MSKTKNIIFDLGGVLLDIDHQLTIDAFKKLGLQHFESMYSQFQADELFEKLETGHISESGFYEAIKRKTETPLSNKQIEDAWNALILHFRPESLKLLEQLSCYYTLYLLSNTNSIHLKCFKKLFVQETGKPLLDGYFTKAWYSHEVGLRKPDAAIFEFALQQQNLQAAETLFIDDTIINVEAARKLGFKTHHLAPSQKIEMLDFDAL